MPADRAKTIAFTWSGDTYVFSAGRFSYMFIEDREDWQYSDGRRDFAFNWLDGVFTISLGYLGQQLNGGEPYTLQDSSTIASAPAVGVVDVLNALKDSNTIKVEYYPLLEDNAGSVYTDKYQVLSNQAEMLLMQAERNGRFNPYVPVKMILQTPLTAYPDWANR